MDDIKQGNMTAVPEPGTFHMVPWAGKGKRKIGEVLCETHWIQDMSYQGACPRTVARRQLEKLDKLGYQLYSGWEMEFRLVDEKSQKPLFEKCDVFN